MEESERMEELEHITPVDPQSPLGQQIDALFRQDAQVCQQQFTTHQAKLDAIKQRQEAGDVEGGLVEFFAELDRLMEPGPNIEAVAFARQAIAIHKLAGSFTSSPVWTRFSKFYKPAIMGSVGNLLEPKPS